MAKDSFGVKNRVVPVDDSLVEYAERRAKEILGENMAYSPANTYSYDSGLSDKKVIAVGNKADKNK